MELSEFRAGILDDVHFNASMNGTSPREEFLAFYAGTLLTRKNLRILSSWHMRGSAPEIVVFR